MVIRQLRESEYEPFHQSLLQNALTEPLSPCYTVPVQLNGVEYALRLQPTNHYKVAALHAIRTRREKNGVTHTLITKSVVLSSLLELLIYQARN